MPVRHELDRGDVRQFTPVERNQTPEEVAERGGEGAFVVNQAESVDLGIDPLDVRQVRGHGFSAASEGLLKLVRMSVYLPRNARILLAAMRMGEFKALSENEIKTRNQFRPGSPEMQRGWEFWARRAGCGDMLANSKGGV